MQFGASLLGVYEFLPNSETMARLGQSACRDEAFFQSLCSSVLFLIGGFNSAQLNSVCNTLTVVLSLQLIHLLKLFADYAASNLGTYASWSFN